MKKYFLLLSIISLIVIFVCSVTLSKSVSESMAVFENFVEGLENSESGSSLGSGSGDLLRRVEAIMNSPSTNIPSLAPSTITAIAENVMNKKMCAGSGSGCDIVIGSGSSLQQTFNNITSAVRQATASDANLDIGGGASSTASTPSPSSVNSSAYT